MESVQHRHPRVVFKGRAFLSHSSRDKWYVDQVYASLGPGQAEYDKETFEKAVLNSNAIDLALRRCDVYVLFVSESSLGNPFVSYETQMTIEAYAMGQINRLCIICIDETAFDQIPEGLRKFNIAFLLSNPGAAARRVQALLVSVRATNADVIECVGRLRELHELEIAITQSADRVPIALTIAGLPGIGRRTLAKKAIHNTLPSFANFIPISIQSGWSEEDMFIALLKERGTGSFSQTTKELVEFVNLASRDKIEILLREINKLLYDGETLLFVDGGGLVTHDGEYPSYISRILSLSQSFNRPAFILIQNYMFPDRVKAMYLRVYFKSLAPLRPDEARSVLGAKLITAGIKFSSDDVERLVQLVDGHPMNMEFAIGRIKSDSRGNIRHFLLAPQELTIWKLRRASDYIDRISFSQMERRVIALLLLFRVLPLELFLELVKGEATELATCLHRLQDLHCIEEYKGVYEITGALQDAFRRAHVFNLSPKLKAHAAGIIVDFVDSYADHDAAPLSLIEPAIVASIRAGRPGQLAQLRQILTPAHVIAVARQEYDAGEYKACIEFCEEAILQWTRMTPDAQAEACRWLALSAIRLGRHEQFDHAISRLGQMPSRHAGRTRLFLLGFRSRVSGDLHNALRLYLQCIRGNRFPAAYREIATVFLLLRSPDEAEVYARQAYEIGQTNPFVIDIMVGVILGKLRSVNELAANQEFEYFMSELHKYGNRKGLSFYSRRMAEYFLRMRNFPQAIHWANKAVEETRNLVLPYSIRSQIHIESGNIRLAEADLKAMQRIVDEGEQEHGKTHIVELQTLRFKIHIAKHEYRAARHLLESFNRATPAVQQELKRSLAQNIKLDGRISDEELLEWAQQNI